MEDLNDAGDRTVEENATTSVNVHQIATCRGSRALSDLCVVFDQDLGQSLTSSSTSADCGSNTSGVSEMYITARSDRTIRTRNS